MTVAVADSLINPGKLKMTEILVLY